MALSIEEATNQPESQQIKSNLIEFCSFKVLMKEQNPCYLLEKHGTHVLVIVLRCFGGQQREGMGRGSHTPFFSFQVLSANRKKTFHAMLPHKLEILYFMFKGGLPTFCVRMMMIRALTFRVTTENMLISHSIISRKDHRFNFTFEKGLS